MTLRSMPLTCAYSNYLLGGHAATIQVCVCASFQHPINFGSALADPDHVVCHIASSSTLPALSNAQTEKLRILTILSLAHNHPPPLSYSTALAALHLPSDQIPVLEALVTKAIYSDLLTARLSPTTNTENGVGCVYITSVKPVRDVPLSNVPMMETVLSEARNRCARAIADVEAEAARVIDIAQTRASQEHEKKKKLDRLYDKEASLMAARAATAAADRRPDSRRSLHAREDWGRDIAGVMPQILPAYATRLPGMDEVKLDELR